MQTRKLTSAALLIAIGTLSAHLIYIPAGVSKCFPVQHAINVMGAVRTGLQPLQNTDSGYGWRNIRYRHHRWFRRLDYGHTAFRQQGCSLVLYSAVFGKHHRWQRYRLPAAQNRLFQAVQQQRR